MYVLFIIEHERKEKIYRNLKEMNPEYIPKYKKDSIRTY